MNYLVLHNVRLPNDAILNYLSGLNKLVICFADHGGKNALCKFYFMVIYANEFYRSRVAFS